MGGKEEERERERGRGERQHCGLDGTRKSEQTAKPRIGVDEIGTSGVLWELVRIPVFAEHGSQHAVAITRESRSRGLKGLPSHIQPHPRTLRGCGGGKRGSRNRKRT
jgi:hypothetical protein